MRTVLFAGVLVATLSAGVYAQPVDHPVSGKRLVVKNDVSGGKFVFVSKDPTLLFPVPGSADDPRNPNTPFVYLVTPVDGALLPIPGGPDATGWKVISSGVPTYVYTNPAAPLGGPVRKLVLKQGRMLRVVSASPGLQLAAPSDRIGISVSMGSLRNCTVFMGDAARQNLAGRFVAGVTPAPTIADCYTDSLLGITTTTSTTSTTSTTLTCDCGGTCGPTEECARVGAPGDFGFCGCVPIGATPCGSPGMPTCGGECPTDMFCSAYFATYPAFGVGCRCALAGTQCPNGLAWGQEPELGFPPACYPIPCSGQYPTCGGSCGEGGTCSAYTVDGGSFAGCICAVDQPCDDTSLGFACGSGDICHISGSATRACSPP